LIGTLCYEFEPSAPYWLIVAMLVPMAVWPMPAGRSA